MRVSRFKSSSKMIEFGMRQPGRRECRPTIQTASHSVYAIEAACRNAAYFQGVSEWFWCMLKRGEPKRGISGVARRERRRIGKEKGSKEGNAKYPSVTCPELGAKWQERSGNVRQGPVSLAPFPRQQAGHRKKINVRGPASRRGPHHLVRMEEPNREEAQWPARDRGRGW